jgi:hypothetical protein
MRLRLEPLPGTTDTAALLYGPLVLAGELGRVGLDAVSPYAKISIDLDEVPTPEVPVLVAWGTNDLLARVKPVPGRPLAFRTDGVGRPYDVTLAPLYQVHHQRYSVYWDLFNETGWSLCQEELAQARTRGRAAARRIIDSVRIGDPDSEASHGFKADRSSSGTHQGRAYRDAYEGGWFSYDVAVVPDSAGILQATFWGDDSGPRTFDIVVGGRILATQTLNVSAPGKFFDVRWPLAKELTAGTNKITVQLQAHPGNKAGGLFGLATLKPE